MNVFSGKLTIIILRANLTRDVCSFGSMDPSCTLRLSHIKMFKSSVKSNEGKYPIWNETAVFVVENEITLKVEVNHEKEIIGGTEINLTNIYSLGKVDETDYKIFYNNSETGKIRLKFTFESNSKKTVQGNTNSNNFGYNNQNPSGNTQGYNQGYGANNQNYVVNTQGYNQMYGGNNQGLGYNNQGLGTYPVPITNNTQSNNPYGNNPYLTGNPLNLGVNTYSSSGYGNYGNNNTGFSGGNLGNNGGYGNNEVNPGFSGGNGGFSGGQYGLNQVNPGFSGGQYGVNQVNPGFSGGNGGFSGGQYGVNQVNPGLSGGNGGFSGGQYGVNQVNPGFSGGNGGFSGGQYGVNQVNPGFSGGNGGFSGGQYGNTSYSGGNTGFSGGQYGVTPDLSNQNNNLGFSNQGNLLDYKKSYWYKSLSYFKNVLFFRHNSASAYFFQYNSEIWENITNFSGTFFPQFHRLTELPDASFLMTGGEVNGVTLSTTKHFIQGNFLEKPNMLQPRKAHGTAYLKGYIYVFGGYSDNGTILNTCERFDMNNSNWTKIANMNYARGYASTCVFSENLIYIVGGFSPYEIDGASELNRIERYNTLTNKFEELNFRLVQPVYGCFVVPVNETKLLIGGGFNTANGNSNTVYTIDVFNGNINYLPPMINPGWTVLSPLYLNGAIHIFSCGEESDDNLPEHLIYPINLPIN